MQDVLIETPNLLEDKVEVFIKDNAEKKSTFYSTKKTEELLTNLHQFKNGEPSLAVLTGPRSSGKTTLVKYFQSNNPSFCRFIQGQSKVDFQTLFADLLGLNTSALTEMSIEVLSQLMTSQFQELVLIIDDANLLTLENFQKIILFFNARSARRFKLVLVGDSVLQKRVENLADNIPLVSPYVTFRMLGFSLKETKHYLKQSFSFPPHKPGSYSTKMVKSILMLSEGYVGRINRLALQFGLQKEANFVPARKKKSFIDLLLAISIIALLAIVGLQVSTILLKNKSHTQTATLHKKQTHVAKQPNKVIAPPIDFDADDSPSFIASIENLPVEQITPKAPTQKTLTETTLQQKQ